MNLKRLGASFAHKMSATDISGAAAELGYYFLYSIFPFFLFLTAVLAYLPIPGLVPKTLAFFSQVIPPSASHTVSAALSSVVSHQHGDLLSVGILVSLWTASSAVSALTDSLNIAYGAKETRPFWKVRLLAIALTAIQVVLVVAAAALSLFGHLIAKMGAAAGLGEVFQTLWSLARWPAAIVLATLGLMLLYRLTPNVRQTWARVLPGSVVAIAGIVLASIGFAFYVSHFGSYDRTYGSIGAIIVLLTWFYLVGFLVLTGGVVNSLLEETRAQQRAGASAAGMPRVERRQAERRARYSHSATA